MHHWLVWIAAAWDALVKKGAKVPVPTNLPHPSLAGFQRLTTAEPAGQVADWALSLPDGSRIHVHELRSGQLVAHRDRIDPSRSVSSAVRHFLSETRAGKTATVGGAIFAVAKLAAKVGGLP